jgi:hypothetical protein
MAETTVSQVNIDSTLDESRSFEPSAEFSQKAQIKSLAEYDALYKESVEQPEKFWGRAAEELHWFKKWDKVLEWKAPWAKWFVGGELNLSYNCLDRHVKTCAQEQSRAHLGKRARRSSHLHLPAAHRKKCRNSPTCSRSWRPQRRPRRHLHGHDARVPDRHAGLRPHRRSALDCLRRILLQRAGRPHPRLPRRRRHYAGWILPPRRRSQTVSCPSKRPSSPVPP